MPGFIDPGLGTIQPASGSQHFFQRWGAVGQLRSVWNTVFPVSVVSRWRNEDEGSLYATTATAYGAANEYTSCVFVAPTDTPGRNNVTFEVMRINLSWYLSAVINPLNVDIHAFTPEQAYNPVSTLNPVGLYYPGLATHPSGNWGSVIGLGGSNPALPGYIGYQLMLWSTTFVNAGQWYSGFQADMGNIDPPIRLFPGYLFAIQFQTKHAVARVYLRCSILYRQFPEVT